MSPAHGYIALIDGYNVIKRHAAWRDLPLREARNRLIVLLARTRWPVPVSRVLVVFDAPDSEGHPLHVSAGLSVRFAAPSADAEIQQLIRTHPSPPRLIVISDDGEILRTAKSHRTVCHSTQWLVDRSALAARGHKPETDKEMPPAATARQITEELAKRWLEHSEE